MIPREHREVNLPHLRPKAVFGQEPAGQPRGSGEGADTPVGPLYCFQASASRRAGLEAGLGSGEGTQSPGSAFCAPTTRPDPLRSWGAGCHPPSPPTHPPTPAGESLQSPRGLGRGLMALQTTDASSLRNRILLCFQPPFWAPWRYRELGAGLGRDTREGTPSPQGTGDRQSLASKLLPPPKTKQ